MSTAAIQQPAAGPGPGRGATALGADGPAQSHRQHRQHPHPRHRLGSALRAARVFAEATFSVAVLGQYEGRTRERRAHPSPPYGQTSSPASSSVESTIR